MPKTKSQLKNWQKIKLSEITQDIRKPYEPIKMEEKPYVGLEHIEQQTLQLSGVGRSSETQSTKKIFKAGDILFGTLRPYFRKVTRPKFDGVCSTDIAVIRPTENGDGNFLKYFIANQDFIDRASNIAGGTRMPRASWKSLQEMAWLIPELDEQKNIGSFLSIYDNLIENNTKRIKILEEIAQAIYKEWFVYFRFPDHEKVKMIDSKTEFGKIPEGWEVKNLGGIVENYDSKRRPISKMKRQAMQGEIPYYGAAKIIDYVNDYIFDSKYLLLAEDGSVITKSGNPVLQFVNEKFWANNHTHILQGRKVTTEYLYLSLVQFPIQGYLTGVAQPKINQGNLNRIPILVPGDKIAKKFNELAVPVFENVQKLKEMINNLQKSRDSLLPKLVNGEIAVK